MGFFDSLAHEAGKKTGKAIGNKLFGSAAADETINISGGLNNGGSSGDGGGNITAQLELQAQNIQMEAKIREKEKSQKMLDDLLLLEFDTEDLAQNVKILTKLSSMIDVWIKDRDMKSFCDVAMTKFDTGLLISQTIDSNNSFVLIMAKKKADWSAYVEEQAEMERQKRIQAEQMRAQRVELEKQEREKSASMAIKILIGLGLGGLILLLGFIMLIALL